MYMAERLAYYDRIREALLHPDNIMSCISDGMAQNHCGLPYMSGLKEFNEPLGQHLQVSFLLLVNSCVDVFVLQGVLEHGKKFTVYRTFHNITNNANLSIYCLLSQLESWWADKKYFPDKVSYLPPLPAQSLPHPLPKHCIHHFPSHGDAVAIAIID